MTELAVDPRRAAFGDAPEADVRHAAMHGSPRDRWLAAVALGGQGRYAAATAVLRELVTDPDRVLAALAASTLASHRRQMGGHAVARRWDAVALRRLGEVPDADTAGAAADPGGVDPDGVDPDGVDPDGVDLAGAWSDALLGLAADAVGLGRIEEARRLHSAAVARSRPAGAEASWRCRVREGWVAAEIELAAGNPERAIPAAVTATRVAGDGPSLRHRVKSDIVLAASLTAMAGGSTPNAVELVTEGDQQPVPALLQRAVTTSLERGIFSLVWPAAVITSNLYVDTRNEFKILASNALTCVYLRSDEQLRCLARTSPWVPEGLIRTVGPT